MAAPAPLVDDALYRAIAVEAGALPPRMDVPSMQAALIRVAAEHCARIGDDYARGLGDATAGQHIRAVFGL
jgi:hypothetical protein